MNILLAVNQVLAIHHLVLNTLIHQGTPDRYVMYAGQKRCCYYEKSSSGFCVWVVLTFTLVLVFSWAFVILYNIQGVSGEKTNIVGLDIFGNCVGEGKIFIRTFVFLIGYRDTAVWISWPNSVIFWFMELDDERSLQKEGGHTGRIASSHFGCCWLHKETWSSTQTNNTRSSHTSCKVLWGWRWDFGTFIVKCNRLVI
jgi:hypothetical protein